jgi:hypothetical protein
MDKQTTMLSNYSCIFVVALIFGRALLIYFLWHVSDKQHQEPMFYTYNYPDVLVYKTDQSSNCLIQNYTLDWRRCKWETS